MEIIFLITYIKRNGLCGLHDGLFLKWAIETLINTRSKCELCTEAYEAELNENTNGSTMNKQSLSSVNSSSSGNSSKCLNCESCAEEIEQCFNCLFGYKKPRVKYLSNHSVVRTEYTLENCIALYKFFMPTLWPEFDSVKKDSISSEVHTNN